MNTKEIKYRLIKYLIFVVFTILLMLKYPCPCIPVEQTVMLTGSLIIVFCVLDTVFPNVIYTTNPPSNNN